MKVAQIGLGAIGSIFARHLLRAQVDLVVFDKSPDRGNAAGRDGSRVAPTIADAVGDVDYLLVSLPDHDANRAVMHGLEGAIVCVKTGAAILELITMEPETCVANEETER